MAAKVDFRQARQPQWRLHHRRATFTFLFSEYIANVQALAALPSVVALHGYQKFSGCLDKNANICKLPEIQCHGPRFDMQGWLFQPCFYKHSYYLILMDIRQLWVSLYLSPYLQLLKYCFCFYPKTFLFLMTSVLTLVSIDSMYVVLGGTRDEG